MRFFTLLVLVHVGAASNSGWRGSSLKKLFEWGPGEVCFALDPGLLRSRQHSGLYVPRNNVPLGVAVHPHTPKVFATVPRWKPGVISTLNWIPVGTGNPKEALRPYPNFEVNDILGNFWTLYKIVSATRVFIDDCDRLWVIDNGYNDQCGNKSQILPPKLLIFDINTDKLLHIHVFPAGVKFDDSSFGKVVVDVDYTRCECAVAYISDVRYPGLVVYNLENDYSFRIKHNFLEKEPLKSQYSAQGRTFNSGNHIDGLALGPRLPNGYRNLFVSAQTSNKQYVGSTQLLQDPRRKDEVDQFKYVGERCSDCLSGGAQDFDGDTGIMFYSDLHSNAISCWDGDINNFRQTHQDYVEVSSELEYVSDLWVTRGRELVAVSDQLRRFFHSDAGVTTRVLVGEVDRLVSGTVCQPRRAKSHYS